MPRRRPAAAPPAPDLVGPHTLPMHERYYRWLLRVGPAPAAEPGQVWEWEEWPARLHRVAMVLEVRSSTEEPAAFPRLVMFYGHHRYEGTAFPPLEARLIAGPGAPWPTEDDGR